MVRRLARLRPTEWEGALRDALHAGSDGLMHLPPRALKVSTSLPCMSTGVQLGQNVVLSMLGHCDELVDRCFPAYMLSATTPMLHYCSTGCCCRAQFLIAAFLRYSQFNQVPETHVVQRFRVHLGRLENHTIPSGFITCICNETRWICMCTPGFHNMVLCKAEFRVQSHSHKDFSGYRGNTGCSGGSGGGVAGAAVAPVCVHGGGHVLPAHLGDVPPAGLLLPRAQPLHLAVCAARPAASQSCSGHFVALIPTCWSSHSESRLVGLCF